MQFSLPQINPVEVLMGFVTLASMALNWRFAASINQIKIDINKQFDDFRRELGGTFVPSTLENAQRGALTYRLDLVEREASNNRERIHDMNNKFSELILGKLASIDSRLQDIERRQNK